MAAGGEPTRSHITEPPTSGDCMTTTSWALKGQGYEFCNCDFGCGCNFGGFPNSKDGSCRALVGFRIASGSCCDVDGGSASVAEGSIPFMSCLWWAFGLPGLAGSVR